MTSPQRPGSSDAYSRPATMSMSAAEAEKRREREKQEAQRNAKGKLTAAIIGALVAIVGVVALMIYIWAKVPPAHRVYETITSATSSAAASSTEPSSAVSELSEPTSAGAIATEQTAVGSGVVPSEMLGEQLSGLASELSSAASGEPSGENAAPAESEPAAADNA